MYLESTVRNFSRYHKYAIGAELREQSRKILRLIIDANSTRDRQALLYELARQCDMMATLLVLAKETCAFDSFKSFQHASGLAVLLGKQSEGWLKSSSGKSSQNINRSLDEALA